MKSFIFLLCFTFLPSAYSAPIEYFEQFFYRKDSIGSDPDFPKYNYRAVLSKFDAPKIQMKNGKFIKLLVNLAIYPNLTFHLHYQEWIYDTDTSSHFFPGVCRIVRGNWKHEDGQLFFDQALRAEEHFADGKNALKLTFTHAIGSEDAVNKSTTASLGYTDRDPEQYFCH